MQITHTASTAAVAAAEYPAPQTVFLLLNSYPYCFTAHMHEISKYFLSTENQEQCLYNSLGALTYYLVNYTRDLCSWIGIFGISVENYDCRLLRPTYGTHDDSPPSADMFGITTHSLAPARKATRQISAFPHEIYCHTAARR